MSDAWCIPGANGEVILGDVHVPDTEPRGVLVICHGFKGYKDYGFFPRLAEAASAAGMIAHRFNFSHSGMTNHVATFERPDLFERDTWGFQISDLESVIGAIRAGTLAGRDRPIVVFGHSRGGVTALLAVARGLDVAGVIAAAAPDTCCNLDESQKAMLRRKGFLPSPSSRTGQELRVGRAWLDEIDADPPKFDPRLAIATIKNPVLLIQGDADETVPLSCAQALKAAAGDRVELLVIAGANHTFNAANPMVGEMPKATSQMFDAVIRHSFSLFGSSGERFAR